MDLPLDVKHVRKDQRTSPTLNLSPVGILIGPALEYPPREWLKAVGGHATIVARLVRQPQLSKAARMQKEGVRNVRRVFLHLYPIAPHLLLDVDAVGPVLLHEHVPHRKRRDGFRWPHVNEEHAGQRPSWVASCPYITRGSLERALNACPSLVKEPPVVGASNAAVLNVAIL